MSYEISVVIAVYNQEKYLRECLDSVVNQTIGIENIEVIAVNDKSTDSSLDILNEYANSYPSIKIINHEENMGAGAAKNTGIEHVTSNYLTFLDSDDFLDENTLKECLNLIKKNDCDLLYFNWQMYPKDIESPHKPNIVENKVISSISQHPSLIFATSTGAKIFHRNIYKYLKFSDNSYDDNVMSVESLLNSKKIYLSNFNGYFYRDNPSSTTNVITVKRALDLNDSIEELFNLCDKYPYESKYIKLLIMRFIYDVILWSLNYWSDEEKLKVIIDLKASVGDIDDEDIETYKKFNPEAARLILDLKTELSKLYIDSGDGFNENESIKVDYRLRRENEVTFNLDKFNKIKKVRFDPIRDKFTKVSIKAIESDCGNLKIKASNSINSLKEEYQLFNTINPMYIIKGNFKNMTYIKVIFEVKILRGEELVNVASKDMGFLQKANFKLRHKL